MATALNHSSPEKLSLGFARITGGPTDFKGANLRSPTGETLGDGGKGKKASGLLCVDGILYLLARNAGNAQLAWSSDHGATWTWADWKFTASLPTKWMSADGRTVHLAFSGDDHFSVRQGTLVLQTGADSFLK